MTLRVFSFGGGVQSTAALVLATRKEIDFPIFLFANVGDDSEHPATLRYVKEHAEPFAAAHGIEFYELRYIRKTGARKGEVRTIYQTLLDPDQKNVIIPMRFGRSGAPAQRACTSDYKVRRIAEWLKRHGATEADPALVGLGISLDEFQRARNDSGFTTHQNTYPLLDLRLTRQDCMNIIQRAGLPIPPKSSCWFCPYRSNSTWQQLKNETPDLFEKAVELEKYLSERNEARGRDKLFLHRRTIPLDQAVGDQTMMFEDDDACESGYCMV